MDEENKIIEDNRGKADLEETERLVEERKKKLIHFIKNKQIWVVGILIIALILGIYIRSLPMTDHGGKPGLWDITTNTWTLGPDLDPWLFERYAKTIVEQGDLPETDTMRNIPLGFPTSKETMLLPYMIVWTYKLLHIFNNSTTVIYAAVIFPVIMFALTIISFFLFVREIFIRKKNDEKENNKNKLMANLISLISTFFMIVIPVFLSRTLAGIPEKESAAFFFMFLTFYLFLKAWKSEKLKDSLILGILAGASTALMSMIWGGYIYVLNAIAIASFFAFLLNKIKRKELFVYSSWFISSLILIISFAKPTLVGILTSVSSGLAFVVFFIMLIHFILWNTKLSNINFLNKTKIPKNILSLIISIIIGFILIVVFLGPSFIYEKIQSLNQTLFEAVTGRWNTTVAENRQPYFTEWEGSFGPHFHEIALTFWLFFIGSVLLFKKMFNKIKNKDSYVLTGLYILFFFGMVFSRYSSTSILNGANFISKFFYLGTTFLLIGAFIYYYSKYYRENNDGFEHVDYEYLFLFSLFILTLFTARSAVRLIMVLGPVTPIFIGYLIIETISKFRKTKDEIYRILLGIFMILIIFISIFSFWSFYKEVKAESYNMVPSYYNQQWQKAMQWVREETPADAVFAHWWDYGYWLQSIGNRATVLDGGNAASFWNYWMGRLVLTGDNQKDALEFLYNHNATHFLIDSSDIGKYGAFSSIGSNEDYDRYSWIGTFLLDETQTQETKNQTLLVYTGGIALDEDLTINMSGKEVFLPGQQTGIGAIIIPIKEDNNKTQKFLQPYAIMIYQNKQYKVDLRYLYFKGDLVYFESGIEATAYILPTLAQGSNGVSKNEMGAAMFLSPRLMRGMLTQVYILNDPFNNFPNFKLAHNEQNIIIDNLNSQGMSLPEFVYFQGVQGPIKIWEIKYTGNEKTDARYTDKNSSKYISWKL
ncbi:MAG: STT3 domain-containing protein [Candidatus Nanoarchaeia archaeon]|nr:STT3 domain-containing protein [Candidatus Nanoarchaeia archaeon]MDD5741415.1 STT3 domain-containing protein [Candidatus Nanoarchaeia archaeon]